MTASPVSKRTGTRRARSADQKVERRQAILEAADEHLRDVGFESFSMASLAKSLGLAKGTLYLYFHTREEVFLALSEEKIDRWANAIGAALTPGMTDSAFCEAFFQTAYADATLLPILMRLNIIVEHNVSIEALVSAKRMMRDRLTQLAVEAAQALQLSQAQGTEVFGVLPALLVGAAHYDKEPVLGAEDLPADVRDFMASFDAHQTFVPNACRIIRGIRTGT